MRLLLVVLFLLAVLASSSRAGEPLTLNECVERALRTIPKLAEAGAAIDLTAAQRREVGASLYPTLRSDVQYFQEPGYREAITNRGLAAGQLLADYQLFDGGRRLAQLRAAQFAEQASTLGLDAARSQVIFDTSVAFYNLVHSAQALEELRNSQKRLALYNNVVSSLRRPGKATANDALRIQLLFDASRVQLNTATHQRERASVMLASLIGQSQRGDLAVQPPPTENPVEPQATAVDDNPALQSLIRNQVGAAEIVRAAQAEKYPTFHLALTAGALGTDPPSTLTRYWGASYGGIISVPIFQGGAINARIDQARARMRQAGTQVNQLRIDLSERLAEARSRYQEAQESSAVLQESIPSADAAFQLSWARFLGGGSITLLEVTDSYNQSLSSHLALLDQQLSARQASAEIAQLTGTNLRLAYSK
jgi:outer membrane protein TolC